MYRSFADLILMGFYRFLKKRVVVVFLLEGSFITTWLYMCFVITKLLVATIYCFSKAERK